MVRGQTPFLKKGLTVLVPPKEISTIRTFPKCIDSPYTSHILTVVGSMLTERPPGGTMLSFPCEHFLKAII